jgi:uncharacterized membrane protein
MNGSDLHARVLAQQGALESLRRWLATIQLRVDEIERELDELSVLAVPGAAAPAAATPPRAEQEPPVFEPVPRAEPPAAPAAPMPRAEPWPPRQPLPSRQAAPRKAPRPRRDVDLAELLGARALAWAGGLVTLLGVVFFFVLAVDRGWIGPVERVGLGAVASAALLAAGIVVRARFGNVYSALAAAGAGIAGGYATLLAAAALYGLVVDLAALLLAAAIAAVGVVLALRWRSQILAGIGLVGATPVPLSLLFEGGLSVIGTGFVAIVFAATAFVAIRLDWRVLLGAGLGASAVQIWLLVAQEGEGAAASVVVLAAAFVALYLASGLVLERRGAKPLERLATTLVLVSAVLAGSSALVLLNGTLLGVDRQGAALVAAAVAYALAAALVFLRPRGRDASALLGALALALAAIGLSEVLTGASLAIAWAAQAGVLAWLGARIAEPRYRLASLAYLTLATVYTLALQAPPSDLYTRVADPAAGVPSLLAVVVAALVFVRYARSWEPVARTGPVSRALVAVAERRRMWRGLTLWLSPLLGVYALSLAVLELVQWLGVRPSFAWGHVAVVAVWAAGATAVLVAGVALARRPLQAGGLVWLGGALLELTLFDVDNLPARPAAYAALALGIGYVAAAYFANVVRRPAPRDVAVTTYGGIALSGALVVGAVTELVARGGALDARGLVLLGAAAGYAGLGATLFPRAGRRDATSAFWAVALVLATVASSLLIESATAVVGAWSAGAAVLASLAVLLRERRLLLGSAALAVLALGRTLVELAPPTDLFVPASGAADGVPALVLVLTALATLLVAAARVSTAAADVLDRAIDAVREERTRQVVTAVAVLAVYALSLSILGVAQLAGGGDVTTDFQRGHTGVSALWGVIGLLALRFGLTRGRPALKLAGFALFGVSLAKLFLYDLTMLSSVTRALSFLAVGAVLLVAGFFYQRLGARVAES